MCERVAAAGLFILALPVLAVAAVAICLEDGFPVLFRHQRVGKGGKLFYALKLRSMRHSTGGPQVTSAGDSRILRSGRILRKYKLDELMQLWNVVRGEMALIGPRPEVPRFVNLADPLWHEVLSVKPGITDASTLLFRDEENLLRDQPDPEKHYRETVLPEKLRLQAAELKRQSLAHSLRVLVVTIYYSFFPARFDAGFVRETLLGESSR